jgi:hypothetical protein
MIWFSFRLIQSRKTCIFYNINYTYSISQKYLCIRLLPISDNLAQAGNSFGTIMFEFGMFDNCKIEH